jgi:ABC-type sugar transport system permease subunit
MMSIINRPKTLKKYEAAASYIFLFPALVCMVCFVIIPILFAFYISLNDWDILTSMKYAGIKNYVFAVQNRDWLKAIGRTFHYSILYVPSIFIMGLSLALIVKHIPKLNGLFRTVYFFPIVLSGAISGLLWKYIMDERMGPVNVLLRGLGLQAVAFLGTSNIAMFAVLIVHVWLQMGYFMIIFLAGLQDVPRELYESARIDGANSPQAFFNITIPCIKNTSFFVLIMSAIGSFQVFDQIKLMTNGGPNSATKLAVQYIYETGFTLYQMGRASAMSFMLFAIILTFTIIQMVFVKNVKE